MTLEPDKSGSSLPNHSQSSINDFMSLSTIQKEFEGQVHSSVNWAYQSQSPSATFYRGTGQKNKSYFLKFSEDSTDRFIREHEGLKLIKQAMSISTPRVFSSGPNHILMELIQTEPMGHKFYSELGKQLAKVHQCSHDQYGLENNNYIGETEQINHWDESWAIFFWNRRLLFQINLASARGYFDQSTTDLFLNLKVPCFGLLSSIKECSLVHGDLWSGNILCGPNQIPYLIDPAAYWGHREVDLAMMELFGSYPDSFYRSYKMQYPLVGNYQMRRKVYNLYHLLNHLNIFGKSYFRQCLDLANELL